MAVRTFCIETLGCRANQADAASLQRQLEELGHCSSSPSAAELLIANTCTVTHRADQDSRQLVRKMRRQNPAAQLVVTGCYAQRNPQELARLGGIDWVVSNTCRGHIPRLARMDAARANTCHVLHEDFPLMEEPFSGSAAAFAGRTRPFVKIQDGCDSRCSYCVIPFVRGPARSVPAATVLRQIRELIQAGHQEIVLTGIHLGTYGRSLEPRVSLVRLVSEIVKLQGLGRLRLSCVEPMCFGRGLLTLATEHEAFAQHFHIPLQSGSARILAAMRRPYRPAQYLELVSAIRSRLPDAAIGTDVMIGFPGESEEDHQESLRFVELSPISHVHVFSYSPRSGTSASRQKELPPDLVQRRSREFRSLATRKRLQFERRFINRTLSGLTLEPREGFDGSVALTGNYLSVFLPGIRWPNNRWVDVIIDSVSSGAVWGRPA